jgi:hypothetical protein
LHYWENPERAKVSACLPKGVAHEVSKALSILASLHQRC